MVIRKGTKDDIDAVSALYNEVCDYLQTHINYPGWRKGIYPDRQDAERGIGEDSLFVAEVEGKLPEPLSFGISRRRATPWRIGKTNCRIPIFLWCTPWR